MKCVEKNYMTSPKMVTKLSKPQYNHHNSHHNFNEKQIATIIIKS